MQRKLSPRDEYLLQQKQRVNDSASLLERFANLKALTVEIAYFDSEDRIQRGEMKYTVNVAHAKSVFRVSCPNRECVEGDFDLSADLTDAITGRHPAVSGELICQGWRNRATIGRLPCHSILRYTLNLDYHALVPTDSLEAGER
jgi:hypothetical protein